MSRQQLPPTQRSRTPTTDQIHPAVYMAIAALLALFVVSSIVAFGNDGYTDYLLAVVALFFVMAVGLPYVLWRVWRRRSGGEEPRQSLRDWWRAECETWQGRLTGRDAAVQMLLPVGACAVGMTAIATVMLLMERHTV
jgi:hypothetical protein